jgi:hypothetical protein
MKVYTYIIVHKKIDKKTSYELLYIYIMASIKTDKTQEEIMSTHITNWSHIFEFIKNRTYLSPKARETIGKQIYATLCDGVWDNYFERVVAKYVFINFQQIHVFRTFLMTQNISFFTQIRKIDNNILKIVNQILLCKKRSSIQIIKLFIENPRVINDIKTKDGAFAVDENSNGELEYIINSCPNTM